MKKQFALIALVFLLTPMIILAKGKNTPPATNKASATSVTVKVKQPTVKPVEPAPAPVETPAEVTCASEIAKYDWPQDIAMAVAKAESGLTASTVGDITLQYMQDGVQYGASYGCLQIRYLPGRPEPSQLLDPAFNVEYGYSMYVRSGWQPWSAYNSGAYLNHIK